MELGESDCRKLPNILRAQNAWQSRSQQYLLDCHAFCARKMLVELPAALIVLCSIAPRVHHLHFVCLARVALELELAH